MQDRIEALEKRIEEISSRLDRLVEEVGALRRGAPLDTAPEAPPEPAAPAAAETGGGWAISREFEDLVARHSLVTLAGLVCLVLAGALILRIVAISAPVPLAAGAGLGLAYCMALMVVAERKFRRGAGLHGDIFAILAVLILGALLVEVTRRPQGFSREASFGVLALTLVVHSWMSIRRDRRAPFIVGVLAAPVAGVWLLGRPPLYPLLAGILAIAVLAASAGMRRRAWDHPRWGPGMMSLLGLLIYAFIVQATAGKDLPLHYYARPGYALPVFAVFFALFVLPAPYVALFRPRRLDPYEFTIAVCGSVVVFWGAAICLLTFPHGELICGGIGALLSLFFYGVAARSYAEHGEESGSFLPLSIIALLYALSALPILFGGGAPLGASYQALAFLLALFAARYAKAWISVQVHLLTFLAFAVFAFTTIDLTPPTEGLGDLAARTPFLLGAGALAVAVFVRLRRGRPEDSTAGQVARIVLTAVLAAGLIEIFAGVLPHAYELARGLLSVGEGDEAVAALWYTLETLILVIGALVVLGLGVRLRLGSVTVLGVGITGLAGLKLFLFDALRVPGGYMVCSSALFGVALLVSSFLYRRYRLAEGGAEEQASEEPPEES